MQKVPVPQFKQIMVFDWDDTLCCSSWLHQNGFDLEKRLLPENLTQKLQQLDTIVRSILQESVELVGADNIFIVTNAEERWVELSSKLYLPETHMYMNTTAIKIISARALFESELPRRPVEWKLQTFAVIMGQEVLDTRRLIARHVKSKFGQHLMNGNTSKATLNITNNTSLPQKSSTERPFERSKAGEPLMPRDINKNTMLPEIKGVRSAIYLQMKTCFTDLPSHIPKCICSFGDSQAERQAAHKVVRYMPQSFAKTMKFIDRPTIEELIFELKCLAGNLKMFVGHGEELDHQIIIARRFFPEG